MQSMERNELLAKVLLDKLDKTELNSLANQSLVETELAQLALDEAEQLRLDLAALVDAGQNTDNLNEDEQDFIHYLTE